MMQSLDYISYLIPTSYGRLSAIFRQPRSTKDILSSVFNYKIWVCWIFIWVVIVLTLLTINHFVATKNNLPMNDPDFKQINYLKYEMPCIKTSVDTCVTEPVLWCFATMSCKGKK